MWVICTAADEVDADYVPTAEDVLAVCVGGWVDFTYSAEQLINVGRTGWNIEVPPPIAGAITRGEQTSRWTMRVTVKGRNIVLTFDPATATVE